MLKEEETKKDDEYLTLLYSKIYLNNTKEERNFFNISKETACGKLNLFDNLILPTKSVPIICDNNKSMVPDFLEDYSFYPMCNSTNHLVSYLEYGYCSQANGIFENEKLY